MNYSIDEEIKARAYKLLNLLPDFNFDFYIAGNCLNSSDARNIHDIDIFPFSGNKFPKSIPECELICETKNATTYKYKGTVIQLCNYQHKSLEDLVDSFDYAHIQVGASVISGNIEVCYTDEWVDANALHTSWYTGSEYPLSSIIRLLKYYQYGQITNGKSIFSIISALANVIERGFNGYEDFKDQIDAIDLGLVAGNDNEFEELDKLFNLLNKGE